MSDREDTTAVMELVTELRTEVDKKGFLDKQKVERLNLVLDDYEKKNQQLVIVEQAAKNLDQDVKDLKTAQTAYEERDKTNLIGAAELKQQVTELEAEIARGLSRTSESDPHAYKKEPEYKALNQWCKEGERSLDEEHKVLLRTSSRKRSLRLIQFVVSLVFGRLPVSQWRWQFGIPSQ